MRANGGRGRGRRFRTGSIQNDQFFLEKWLSTAAANRELVSTREGPLRRCVEGWRLDRVASSSGGICTLYKVRVASIGSTRNDQDVKLTEAQATTLVLTVSLLLSWTLHEGV